MNFTRPLRTAMLALPAVWAVKVCPAAERATRPPNILIMELEMVPRWNLTRRK